MECLATFVVLFLLPLASAAMVVAWRSRTALKKAADEIAELHLAVTALSARVGRDASVAAAAVAPAPRPPAAAAKLVAPAAPAIGGEPATTAASTTPQPAIPSPPAPQLPDGVAAPSAAAAAIDATAARPLAAPIAAPPRAVPPPPSLLPAPPAPPERSLEERLGARLPVWIGAVALVLAAAFLVKYSVDQGWIGPTVRVTLGALFGVALLAGGEFMRRSTPGVAQGLTAAGIAVLFVVELAAVHLYHLIGPATGFALMALTTATAVALALLHGPFVALLGLVGGFLTPVLVSTGQPNALLLFGYLALLQAGLLAVSRRRGWGPLGGLTLLAALAWAVGWTVSPFGKPDAWVIGVFLLITVAATLLASAGQGERWGAPLEGWARAIAVGGALLVSAGLALRTDYGLLEWGFLGLLAAGCLVLARLEPELHALAWLAGAAVCQVLGIWSEKVQPADTTRFFGVAIGALLLVSGGAWALRARAEKPARWAALAASTSLAIDLIAWHGAHRAKLDLPWGWIEIALAALWIVLALPVARRREALVSGEAVLAAAAAAATTLVSLAVPMELERQWITVAWALEVAALVWLAGRLRVPLLAHLAAILTALVGARLLLNLAVFDYPTGSNPIFSWLLYGYGVPIASLAVATVLARRQGRRALGNGTGGVAVALAVVFLALAVHQAFQPGLKQIEPSLAEWSMLSILWLALGCALLAGASAATATPPAEPAETAGAAGETAATAGVASPAAMHPWPELRFGSVLIVFLAIGQAVLAQGLVVNPLFAHQAVGDSPVVNVLLLAYGVPLLLLVAAAALERRLETRWTPWLSWAPRAWSIMALVLLFVVISLEVRQAFHGNYLDSGPTTSAEGYSYSAAWVLLATVLLVAGVARGRRTMRLASMPVMLLAVGKVFLYDTANLSDLYRVFSFLGLGVSLLLLAWVYQRFVFRRGPEAEAGPQAGPEAA